MKLYRVNNEDEYNWIMQKLENEGYLLGGESKPTSQTYEEHLERFSDVWDVFISAEEDSRNVMNYGTNEENEDNEIIEVSELMKPKTDAEVMREIIEGRNSKPVPTMQSDPKGLAEQLEEAFGNDPIQPQHYNKGEIDLYEAWSKMYPMNEFRAGMEMIAMRYMFRDKEDRVQDLDKAIYTLQRLKEYEENVK